MPSVADWAPSTEVEMSRLTVEQVFALFHRSNDDARWLASADAEEYLAVVTYLVARDVRGRGSV
jgi:hypothetical protein